MDRLTLGTVIANRELNYTDPVHGSRSLRVLLGAPVASPDGGEGYCPWQIAGIAGEPVRAAYGVDSFQCRQLVMRMIGANLKALSDGGGGISCAGSEPGDFGFPVD